MAFSKKRTVYFAMDTTTGNLSKDHAIMDNIQGKLEAVGITVKRVAGNKGRGPGAMYDNMKYLYNNNIHDAIMLHLMNGVDPSNIREVAVNGNDNRGRVVRSRGNDAILAWFYGACDCIHPGGSCYNSVRGSETGGRLYNPLQYMEQNKIVGICERNDYNGDKIAEAVIALFSDTDSAPTTTITPTTDTITELPSASTEKTLSQKVVQKVYTKAHYNNVLTATTDDNGAFQIPIRLPIAGEYIVNMNFMGNKDYLTSSRTITIDNNQGEVFKKGLLETITTEKYNDNTTNTTKTGSSNGYDHTITETTTTTYGTETKTETTILDSDAVLYSPVQKQTEEMNIVGTPTITTPTVTVNPNAKDPFNEAIPLTSDKKPQFNMMQNNGKIFEAVDLNKSYTLTREQYNSVFIRDSKIMQLENYNMTPYVAFECQEEPNKYLVLERERWNMIEESYYYFMVKGGGKKRKYAVIPYPEKVVIDFKNQTSTWDGNKINWKAAKGNIYYCADNQNMGRTCGPTASSVTTQVLHNYYSERRFEQDYIHAQSAGGSGPSTLKDALKYFGFSAQLMYSTSSAVSWLKEGKPVVFHVYDHYIALCDIDSDGKVLVLNSTTSSSYGPSTGWVTQQTLKNKYYSTGVLVGLNWNISNDEKQKLKNFYQSMGGAWKKVENKSEKVRYYQLSY